MPTREVHKFSYHAVNIDLMELQGALITAVRQAKEDLYKQMSHVEDEVSASLTAQRNNDTETAYREMCHANTGAQWVVEAAQNLEREIHSLFAVSEALRRDDVTFSKPTKE